MSVEVALCGPISRVLAKTAPRENGWWQQVLSKSTIWGLEPANRLSLKFRLIWNLSKTSSNSSCLAFTCKLVLPFILNLCLLNLCFLSKRKLENRHRIGKADRNAGSSQNLWEPHLQGKDNNFQHTWASETNPRHSKSKIEHLKKETCKVGVSGTLIAFHLNFWLSGTLTKRKK